MTDPRQDTAELLRRIRYDATAIQAKITDALTELERIPTPPDTNRDCPLCGLRTRGPLSLAEHVHRNHDGPYPEHWAREDTLYG